MPPTIAAYRVHPTDSFRELSRAEVARLLDSSSPALYELFRRCALAVMSGGEEQDDAAGLLEVYRNFQIEVCPEHRGVELAVRGAPACAFVDGRLIRGVRELLYAVLRDILYINLQYRETVREAATADATHRSTEMVFAILRNAGVLNPSRRPDMVVCWGGHAIGREEYKYTKEVGYQLGLRGYEICTGCGPGAMKGPMKGASLGHSKQRMPLMRYLGITEPGIIAAESPNPIVNELVIMPDIEKRLEAFVRLGHGVVVFPGGVGTAEEILYLLGIMCAPENDHIPFPFVWSGPASSRAYFEQLDRFVGLALGEEARTRYQIIIDDPQEVARTMKAGINAVEHHRTAHNDAWHFNWTLTIPPDYQAPFMPTHESMAALRLDSDQPTGVLAADLRRAFSGIVAGNIKPEGIELIRRHGPFELAASPELMSALDDLLRAFAEQGRMKLGTQGYVPCYTVKSRQAA